MQIFRIPIPDKKRNSFYFLSLFIFILNLIIFLRIITVAETYQKWVGIFGSLICVSGIILSYLKRKKRPGILHILHFILLTLTWIFLPAVIPAICIAIFTALAYLAGKERWLLIGESGIQFPSFPPQKLPWRNVSDIILKDLVLTINLADNRYIQLVLPPNSFARGETDFLQTCQEWIRASRQPDKS